MYGFSDFFLDPVLMAPTIGSMLMCLLGALIGTFAVIKRYSLVGEMLSHACYPGVIFCMLLPVASSFWLPILGAAGSSVLGMGLVALMQNKFKVKADAALTFVLASFFGIGLTVLTSVQNTKPALYKKMQSYLFGQAATMTNEHVWIYFGVTTVVLIILFFCYRLLTVSIFDPEFAKVAGFNIRFANFLLLGLVVVATVIGIRSVGVALMSSMLIFPAVTARFWTGKIIPMLILAGIFGLICGFFGIYFSHTLSIRFATSLPTGPSIVLVASALFFISVLFSTEQGIIVRVMRRIQFWNRCQQENLLKAIWKKYETGSVSLDALQSSFHENKMLIKLLLFLLQRKGNVRQQEAGRYELTASGQHLARKIVRLHKLWELYLVQCCGAPIAVVHPSAEEMEHILTPEIESELEELLGHPIFREDEHESV